jgi:hypothetical protein
VGVNFNPISINVEEIYDVCIFKRLKLAEVTKQRGG